MIEAKDVRNLWNEWNNIRLPWLKEKENLIEHLFAESTHDTENKKLPWSNNTTIPKLTQIYDNLKANYMAALFPNSDWMVWEAQDKEASDKAKKIQGYLKNKLKHSGFEKVMEALVDDFIIYGNCFGYVDYVIEEVVDSYGYSSVKYTGPVLRRVSPADIVFDATASSFKEATKIVRSVVSVDWLMGWAIQNPEIDENQVRAYLEKRSQTIHTEPHKDKNISDEGVGFFTTFKRNNTAELLTMYYPSEDGRGRKFIIVLDGEVVLQEGRNPSWLGIDPVFKAGWRNRPDNLWSMGPLDNLVGMQYRIDHLENLKADVFDQVALPMLVIKGGVEDFTYGPGSIIQLHDDGDIRYLYPDTTALNADTQTALLEQKMEEMAGAPKMAMGFRTPGEKTAFEVQTLMTAASRIFQHKAEKFEREFIEPILNVMLEVARRNMETDWSVYFDPDINANVFEDISKEDIQARGRIIPKGARHFAESAKRTQELMNLLQLKQIPDVGVHLSGETIARLVAESIGEPDLFKPAVAVQEQAKVQEVMLDIEAQQMDKLQAKADMGV